MVKKGVSPDNRKKLLENNKQFIFQIDPPGL